MDENYSAPKSDLTIEETNTSGMGKGHELPKGIKGWSWGAFLLNWIWAAGNRTWIGLLAFLPLIGIVIVFVLGFKGREWAWRNKKWKSVEHFQSVQRKWSIWGLIILIIPVIGIVAAIALPAYQDYLSRAVGG